MRTRLCLAVPWVAATLPAPVSPFVKQRIREVLTGQDQGQAFSHLTAADRQAITDILQETKPDVLR